MFVRFRATARRLHASLVENHRHDGKVRHEHVASLGSVPLGLSRADRIAFWTALHPRLAKLDNRLDATAKGAILAALHARIPMATPDEQQAERLTLAAEGAKQWDTLASVQTATLADKKSLLATIQREVAQLEGGATATKASAEAAKESLAHLERDEDRGIGRPLTRKEMLKGFPWRSPFFRVAAKT